MNSFLVGFCILAALAVAVVLLALFVPSAAEEQRSDDLYDHF